MSPQADYNALDSIQAVRVNTGMFIGDTDTPDHLATEIIDNMLDEIANGFATIGKLYINDEDNSFWISDNGRGLKLGQTKDPDTGEMVDSIKLLCTKLFSGSKFRLNGEVDYKVQIGMHGVGLVVVNALSDWLVIRIRKKNIIREYVFIDSVLEKAHNFQQTDEDYSTLVGFKPKSEYFNTIAFNVKMFVERLLLAQSVYDKASFFVNDKKIPKISLLDYAKNALGLTKETKIFQINQNFNENENIKIFLTYEEKSDSICLGDVNLRRCEGTYLTNIQTIIKNIIKNNIDKKFKDINEREFLTGLRLYVNLTLEKPKVDAQIKTRIRNSITKQQSALFEKDLTKILTSSYVMNILTSLLEKKFTKKIVSSKSGSKRISNENKLRDCQIIPGEVLYIVEGDSADGTLTKIRDKKTEASFPLKGKMLNVIKGSLLKIEKNKEVQDLLEALGPSGSRRYKKIKILADADSDGFHIDILVALFMQKFVPDMVKKGAVSVLLPPLFIATSKDKKTNVPIYKVEDIEQYKKQGFNISTRFKGLGQMEPEQLEIVIRSGLEYILKYPEDEKIMENLLENIVNNTNVRKALLDKEELELKIVLNQAVKINN